MSINMTNVGLEALRDVLLRGGTPPAAYYVAGLTAATDIRAGNVTAYTGVPRIAITNDASNWTNGTTNATDGASCSNTTRMESDPYDADTTISHLGLYTAASGGDLHWVFTLDSPQLIPNTKTLIVPVNKLVLKFKAPSPDIAMTDLGLEYARDRFVRGGAAQSTYHMGVLTAVSNARAGTVTEYTEVSRVAINADSGSWTEGITDATGAPCSNTNDLNTTAFLQDRAITHVGLFTAATSGSLHWIARLGAAANIPTGEVFPLAANRLTLRVSAPAT